jgi:hypothetical protein
MNQLRIHTLVAACTLALAGAAQAQTSSITTAAGASGGNAVYLKRTETRFGGFTGSSANSDSLAAGLRDSKPVTLTGSGEVVMFRPPTRPMGNGNVTRAMDLAQRDLAAAGISNPTPTQIQAAMMGGTINTPNGPTTFQGVLTLRSQGMGWGQIAHTVGVHPGLGKSATVVTPHASGAATTGLGTASAKSGVVTAAGGNPSSSAGGGGRALGHSGSASVTTAAGASAGAGGGAAAGRGQGNAFGHGK